MRYLHLYKQREGHNTLIDECVEHKHQTNLSIHNRQTYHLDKLEY